MSNEQLVELITKEVMSRIQNMMNEKASNGRKKILVLEHEKNLCSVLLSVLNEKNYKVDCLDDMKSTDCYDAIIFQGISNKELANLSMGIEGSLKEKTAIEALLEGHEIYSLKSGVEYKKYKAKSNKLFYNMFMGYEEKLNSFGVHQIELKELLASLEADTATSFNKTDFIRCQSKEPLKEKVSDKIADLSEKKLISEVELKNIYKSGIEKVSVSKKSILTPLAMDYVRINKIKINRV